MKNTKLPKALITALILLSLLILTWKAIKNYEFESFFFYLFFVVLFIHILYGGFKLVDFFGVEFKMPDILFNSIIALLTLLIAYLYPDLILQFILLSLLFIMIVWDYHRLMKKARNLAYKKYAREKIKLEAGGILLFIAVALILYFTSLELVVGVGLFLGQLLWILWMFFVKRVYSVKGQ